MQKKQEDKQYKTKGLLGFKQEYAPIIRTIIGAYSFNKILH